MGGSERASRHRVSVHLARSRKRDHEHECRRLIDGAAFAEHRVLGRWFSGLVGNAPFAVAGDWTMRASGAPCCSLLLPPTTVPFKPRSPRARIRTKGRTGQGVGAAPT